MSVRVYTRNRAAAIGATMAGCWIPVIGQASFVGAVLTSAGMAAHNLVTINPDWELGKDRLDGALYVDYKK